MRSLDTGQCEYQQESIVTCDDAGQLMTSDDSSGSGHTYSQRHSNLDRSVKIRLVTLSRILCVQQPYNENLKYFHEFSFHIEFYKVQIFSEFLVSQ